MLKLTRIFARTDANTLKAFIVRLLDGVPLFQ